MRTATSRCPPASRTTRSGGEQVRNLQGLGDPREGDARGALRFRCRWSAEGCARLPRGSFRTGADCRGVHANAPWRRPSRLPRGEEHKDVECSADGHSASAGPPGSVRCMRFAGACASPVATERSTSDTPSLAEHRLKDATAGVRAQPRVGTPLPARGDPSKTSGRRSFPVRFPRHEHADRDAPRRAFERVRRSGEAAATSIT